MSLASATQLLERLEKVVSDMVAMGWARGAAGSAAQKQRSCSSAPLGRVLQKRRSHLSARRRTSQKQQFVAPQAMRVAQEKRLVSVVGCCFSNIELLRCIFPTLNRWKKVVL